MSYELPDDIGLFQENVKTVWKCSLARSLPNFFNISKKLLKARD